MQNLLLNPTLAAHHGARAAMHGEREGALAGLGARVLGVPGAHLEASQLRQVVVVGGGLGRLGCVCRPEGVYKAVLLGHLGLTFVCLNTQSSQYALRLAAARPKRATRATADLRNMVGAVCGWFGCGGMCQIE